MPPDARASFLGLPATPEPGAGGKPRKVDMRRVIADLVRTELTEARAAALAAPALALRRAAASVSAAQLAAVAAAAAFDASEVPALSATAAAAVSGASGAPSPRKMGGTFAPASARQFPGLTADWTMALPDVKDQRGCAACWAFAATGVLEAARYISRGELTAMSDQQLVDCNFHSRLGNWGCDGGCVSMRTLLGCSGARLAS